MKRLFIIILFLPFLKCGCTYYFNYTYNVCFINNLNEKVLVKDEGFSRGVIPFFIQPKDTYNFERNYQWEQYAEMVYNPYSESIDLDPDFDNATAIKFNVFRPGIKSDFTDLYQSFIITLEDDTITSFTQTIYDTLWVN